MRSQWTIERVTVNRHEAAQWSVLEEGHRVFTYGSLSTLLAEFSDLVLAEFDGIAKEVAEA